MRLKQRAGDFRVRELLTEGYLGESGEHRVYRITKRKVTTPQAIQALAEEAGVDAGEVGIAGYKDRQAISIQYMSVAGGRAVRLRTPELRVETAGFASESLSSAFSRGNAFELNVRDLTREDVRRLRRNLPIVREHGLVDYFDDQRFGNLTHGQGWIVKELMLGRYEDALRALLASPSPRDDERHRFFKAALARSWGDWRACRAAAGKFGGHHSVFEHLAKNEGDFAGAFTFVAARTRLIHLFAWQSHLWNRAVVDLVRECVPLGDRVLMDGEEGILVSPGAAPPPELVARGTFRLPGEGLEDVADETERRILEDVLAREGMVADQLRLEDVSGFRLKGEDRPMLVRPQHLRVRPAEEDPLHRGAEMVRIRFELPRGAYASLVIKRLFARTHAEHERESGRPPRGPDRSGPRREGGGRRPGRAHEDRGRSAGGRGERRGEEGRRREGGRDEGGWRRERSGTRDDRRTSHDRDRAGRGRADRAEGGGRSHGGGRGTRPEREGDRTGRDDRGGYRGGSGGRTRDDRGGGTDRRRGGGAQRGGGGGGGGRRDGRRAGHGGQAGGGGPRRSSNEGKR